MDGSSAHAGQSRAIASAHLDDKVIVERPLLVPLADDGITHRLLPI
jgi:hypothetical protein